MHPYRPEGLFRLPPSPDALHKAASTGQILQAMCTKCDERHDLHVDLGPIRGIIPREEAALDLPHSKVRDIALLSRVGKCVSFQVLSLEKGHAILSRKAAQKEAQSYFLSALRPGDIIEANVLNPAEFGVFCDIGCGITALMRIDRCCISRLETTSQRFYPGQKIHAAILHIDDRTGLIDLTGKELLGTWSQNAKLFHPGQTVTGFVRSAMPYGLFVELTPNLSGLSEPDSRVSPGDAVSVYIRSINEMTHKIKLNILQILPHQPRPPELQFYLTSGHLETWEYFPGSANTTYF